jgi:hypothetical protein
MIRITSKNLSSSMLLSCYYSYKHFLLLLCLGNINAKKRLRTVGNFPCPHWVMSTRLLANQRSDFTNPIATIIKLVVRVVLIITWKTLPVSDTKIFALLSRWMFYISYKLGLIAGKLLGNIKIILNYIKFNTYTHAKSSTKHLWEFF